MIFSKIFPTVSKFDNKKFLLLMIIVNITVLIDSQIGYVADFIPNQLSSIWGISAFFSLVIIFTISQYFILAFLKELQKENKNRVYHIDVIYIIVSISQYILAGLLFFVLLQILTSQQYSLITQYVSHTISYGLWIITLGLLARGFLSWFRRSNQNVMIMLLTLSMIAYVVNGVTTLATYLDILKQQNQVVLSTDVAYFPEFSIASLGSQINLIGHVSSSIAYVLSWIRYCQVTLSIYSKIGKNQVLVYYEWSNDLLSCYHFLFLYWAIYSPRKYRCNDKYLNFYFKCNFYGDSIWSSIFISGKNVE